MPYSSWEWLVSTALPGAWPDGWATYPIQVLLLEDAHLQAFLGHLQGVHFIHQRAVEQLHQVHAEVMVGLLGRRWQVREAGVHVVSSQAAAAVLQRLQELVEPAAPAGSPLHGPQQFLRPLHFAPLPGGRPHLLPVLRAQRGKLVQHRLHPDELLQPRPEAGDHVEESVVSGRFSHRCAGGARDTPTAAGERRRARGEAPAGATEEAQPLSTRGVRRRVCRCPGVGLGVS